MSTPQSHTTRHRAMMLALCTEKACDVALKFDITESRLSVLRNSPLWKEEERLMVEELQKETRLKIIGNTSKAVDVLVGVMEDEEESGSTRVRAGSELLSRGGFPSGVVVTMGSQDTSYEGVTESIEAIQAEKARILKEAGLSAEDLFSSLEEEDGEFKGFPSNESAE